MEDIRDILELREPTMEFVSTLKEGKHYCIILNGGAVTVASLVFYKTTTPKFIETCRYPGRYEPAAIKYIIIQK